jgi:hypothetical protein
MTVNVTNTGRFSVRANSIQSIHPEYLRAPQESNPSLLELAWHRYGIFSLALLFILGSISVWTLRASVVTLEEEIALLRNENVKTFKEYDALHQVIVERLKRHGEIVKGFEAPRVRQAAEASHGVVTVPRANVRSQPDPSSTVLMTLPLHSRLLIEEQVNGWFRVTTPNGTSGYLSKDVFTEAP